MRLAVVPVMLDNDGNLGLSDEHVGIASAYAGPEYAFLLDGGGKLTKEQVEVMAKVFVETMWKSGTWDDAMKEVVKSIGLGVE